MFREGSPHYALHITSTLKSLREKVRICGSKCTYAFGMGDGIRHEEIMPEK